MKKTYLDPIVEMQEYSAIGSLCEGSRAKWPLEGESDPEDIPGD